MHAAQPLFLLAFVAQSMFSGSWPAHADGPRYTLDSDKPYAEVIADLKVAISEHNYRVTGENVIGEALGRRHDKAFPKSLVVHFCNLEHARQILSAAPDFLLHMPCKVAVYEYAAKVRIETWLLPA
ncbi:MAG: DUF302 domain-containing protein, partial [Gammaproteobacteria bacterium]|nr:DUF302 domain-containing protein [Gammaproteobacteria bacterium]